MTHESELAVHVRKVDHVRQWLREALEGGPTGKLKKYRVRDVTSIFCTTLILKIQRFLVLTGAAGTAKTATLRVLSNDLKFDIIEWRNGADEIYRGGDSLGQHNLAIP